MNKIYQTSPLAGTLTEFIVDLKGIKVNHQAIAEYLITWV
jgi:hypothetical protein